MPQLRPSTTHQGDRFTNDASTLDPGELVAAIVDRPVDALLGALEEARPRWYASAECRGSGVDMFATDRAGVAEALQLCGVCVARPQCLAAALDRGEAYGIWGGCDPAARKAIARRRKATT